MALERLLPSDEIMGPDTYRKINAVIDEVNTMMPDLTKVDWNGNHDTPVKSEAAERKEHPMATGVLDYFPDALYEIAKVSKIGNDQHNPGLPLHWAKEKSTDHPDALLRHLKDRGTRDTDGERHSAKVAWRALALLQTEIDNERK